MSDSFELDLTRIEDFQFRADFGMSDVPPLFVDEPPPLGQGAGPNPTSLLAVAVGNCLSASLLFCLGKSRVEVGSVKTHVVGEYRRNERGRLRIGGLEVSIRIEVESAARPKLEKCLASFEDFCVVTASVREGLDVTVNVLDPSGEVLFTSHETPER